MIKILHGADFHLDSPLDSLSPEKAASRRGELRDAVKRMIDLSLQEEIDIILLSGDLFDTTGPFAETCRMLISAFSRAKARIFISPGNHDWYGLLSPYRLEKWPENVHVFKESAIEAVALPELGVTVYGAAFTSPTGVNSMLDGFCADGDGIKLMTLHGSLGGAEERYNPITEQQIAHSGLTYLALGHTHDFSGKMTAGKTDYAYPGCIEGRGFDETGDKGVIIGEISENATALKFVPLCRRRYRRLELDITERDPSMVLAGAIDCPEDIYRVYLKGEADAPDLRALNAEFGDKVYYLELRDATHVKKDIWLEAGGVSLRGVYLEKLRAAYDGAGEAEKERLDLAVRFALAALDKGERPGGEGN